MPFPYVEQEKFERELPFDRVDLGIDAEAWDGLLSDSLKAETERVEGYADKGDWRDADADDVPFVVQMCVIRLARQRIAGIKEDGLDSERLASGANYKYRPPEELRNEVKSTLDDAGYRSGGGIFVPEVK